MNIIVEGAGKMVAQGESMHFYVTCAIVDTLSGKEVIDGVGDCEFKSTEGNTLYGHFQTIPGHGDRESILLQRRQPES